MKNQIFVTLIVFAIFFVTSCTNSKAPQAGPGLNVEYSVDTIVTQDVPVLVDRNNCEKKIIPVIIKNGKPIGQKVDGWEEKKDSISMSGVVNISDQKLNEAGYKFSGDHINDTPTAPSKSKSYNNGFVNALMSIWNFVGVPLGFIFALILLGIILYQLFRFIRWLLNQIGSGKREEQQLIQKKSEDVVKPVKEVREDRIFLIGGLGLTTETLFRGQVQNHNGVQNIFNVSGDSNTITINTNYPIEKKEEPKQP